MPSLATNIQAVKAGLRQKIIEPALVQKFIASKTSLEQVLDYCSPKKLASLLDHLGQLIGFEPKKVIRGEELASTVEKNFSGSKDIRKNARAQFEICNYFLQANKKSRVLHNPEQELAVEDYQDSDNGQWQRINFTALGNNKFQGLANTRFYFGPITVLINLDPSKPGTNLEAAHKLVQMALSKTLRQVPLARPFKIVLNSSHIPKFKDPQKKLMWLQTTPTNDFLASLISFSSASLANLKSAIKKPDYFRDLSQSTNFYRLINVYLKRYGYEWNNESPYKIVEAKKSNAYCDTGLENLRNKDGSFDLNAVADRAYDYFTNSVKNDPEGFFVEIFGEDYKQYFLSDSFVINFQKNLQEQTSKIKDPGLEGLSFSVVIDNQDYFTSFSCGNCSTIAIDKNPSHTATLLDYEMEERQKTGTEPLKIKTPYDHAKIRFQRFSKNDTFALVMLNDNCLRQKDFYQEVIEPYRLYEKSRGQNLVARVIKNSNENLDQAVMILQREDNQDHETSRKNPSYSRPHTPSNVPILAV